MDAQPNQSIETKEQLEQLKEDFLSSISHELRSPLANIKMATQMLKVLFQQDEKIPQLSSLKTRAVGYIQILERECDREICLLNNVLDLHQLDAGTYGFSEAIICLQDWLPEVVRPFLTHIAKQQQQLQVEGIQPLPTMTTDPLSFERLLSELLTNACKFTPPGGKILIAARLLEPTVDEAASMLQLSMTNSGAEIPASELSRIFERFYRFPSPDRWKHSGTGLGLALVKALTEHLGGTVTAKSSNGQTCFTVTIPIDR